MRNILLVHKFTSTSPLPLPTSSVFCAGESGCLFGCIGIGPGGVDVEEEGQQDGQGGDSANNHDQFLSNLVRISEFNHIEELVKSNLLQGAFLMQFIPSTECLFVATLRGAFLQYYLNNEVEELFQSEAGISNFSVSPDSRLVTIITKAGGLLLLSLPDLEMIIQEELVQPALVENEDPGVTICWRHDSRFVVVNFPVGANERRLRIYEETGGIFAATESTVLIMNNILAWQKTGALIASLEKSPRDKDDCLVSFFEVNGLKRSEFNPFEGRNAGDRGPILSLSWNTGSDILALRKKNKVELWHRSNYVWMCKRSIATSRKSEEKKKLDDIKFFAWDSESPYKIYIVFESGFYSAYELTFGYSTAKTGDSCITASVNANTICYTPFRDNCAPPPFGYRQISFESILKEVVLSSFWNGFLAILSSGKTFLVKNGASGPEIVRWLKSDDDGRFRSSYSWIWPNSKTLCGIKEGKLMVWELPSDLFLQTDVMKESNSTIHLKSSLSIYCFSLTAIEREGEESTHIVLQKTDGALLLFDLATLEFEKLMRIPPNSFQTIGYLFAPSTEETSNDLKSNLIIIAHDPLTRKLEAFLPPKSSYKLATDCTSVQTFENYLLYTTIQGSLEIVHAKDLHSVLQSSTASGSQTVEKYSRKIEKGSIIVSCCWNRSLEPSLILQVLPRGNLETVYPRPLVIASIRVLLRDEKKRSFSTIMTAMRRHRINANILIDELNLVEAEGTCNLTTNQAIRFLVEEVRDANLLVLFVTELSAENLESVKTMKNVLESLATNADKRKDISLPYLAAMAKLGLYEDALHSPLISEETDREKVKSHIKFLSFYSENSEVLYEAALGTYDLSLTAVVADCLNKDPKEYIPILNNLQSLSPEKRCFSIDNTLKKYSKAVKSLILDTTVQQEEVLKFVERHRLFPSALKIIDAASEVEVKAKGPEKIQALRKEIQICYGRYLESSGKLREASVLYRRGRDISKALDCCVKCASWEAALTIAYEEKLSPEEFNDLCKRLLAVLEDQEDFEGAARLCESHLKNCSLAVEFWVRGKKWLTAASLAVKTNSTTNFIKPKLAEQAKFYEEFIQTTKESIVKYALRLRTVKIIKAQKQAAAEDGTGENFSDSESVSTTSSFRSSSSGSITSSMTGKTRQSSKNKRKAERKIFSLKEDSKFEDLAISIHLWDIFTRLHQEIKRDMAYTIESLWRFELDDTATTLSALFDDLVREVDVFIKEIWSTPLPENPLLDSKYRVAPIGWSTSWDKLSFSTSSGAL